MKVQKLTVNVSIQLQTSDEVPKRYMRLFRIESIKDTDEASFLNCCSRVTDIVLLK